MEKKFLLELEEILELPSGTLKSSTLLASINSWDSMAKLSLIVLLSDQYNVKVSNEELKKFITVQNILNFIKK